jgi:class 3 adenylate cyclase
VWREDAPVDAPETQYATTSDGVHVAYQVVGSGAFDFVQVGSPWVADIELEWEWDFTSAWFRWFSARGRYLLFDRRGSGLSDRVIGDSSPTLEARMEDIRTVMDAAGIERGVLVGAEDGAALTFLFAATYPQRTAAVISMCPSSRGLWAPDAPWLETNDVWDEWLAQIEAGWGSRAFIESVVAGVFPSRVGDEAFARAYGRVVRHSLSPGAALAAERMKRDLDVRDVLPVIQAPTLVIHFTDDPIESVQEARYIASHIPGAELVEVPGREHVWWPGLPAMRMIDERVDRFLASLHAEQVAFDRVLATVLFTDIVRSTERAAEIGDLAWKELLERHHQVVRAMIGRYRGVEIDTTGDGFFATFDGPARAVRCAQAIMSAVRPLGIEVRCGVHTGEIEYMGDNVGGMGVHIGARVGGLAGASEVIVSGTVHDLVVGSGLKFDDRGVHQLKGVPGEWHLYKAADT